MLLFSLLICPPLWIKFNILFLLTYPLCGASRYALIFFTNLSTLVDRAVLLLFYIYPFFWIELYAFCYYCPHLWIEHFCSFFIIVHCRGSSIMLFCCPLLWIELYAFCYFCPLLWIEHYAFCYYYPLCGSSFVLLLLLSTFVERAFML